MTTWKGKKIFVKEAGVVLIAAVMLFSSLAMAAQTNELQQKATTVPAPLDRDIIFSDDFESYADFLIDFPPWTNIDVDGSPTFGSSVNNWEHEGEPQAFIIFNPSATTPPWTDPNIQPHGGAKFAGCFNDNNVGYFSDDWLITPRFDPANFDEVSFYAKSFNNQYNLERFQVGISTTDTDPSSFTIISPPPYIIPPYETWTLYSFNLDNYDNQAIYIGIHMMSQDSWLFMVDDFSVTGTIHVPESHVGCIGSLGWDEVKPGATVNGTFQIKNVGEIGSLLNWKVDSWPSWGTWTFIPNSGAGLAEGDAVTITVQVIAPAEKKTNFTGKVKVINSDNISDFCEINVYLKTPLNQDLPSQSLLTRLFERFPHAFPFLRHLLGS